MNRNSLLEMSGRVMHMGVRFTLNKGNDNPMMQELHFDGMHGDGRDRVERMQNYGFSSTPLPRDQQQQGGGDSGGGNGGDSVKGPAAEGICMFMGGQRNHPVCIGIDDRRHRPMGLQPGENAQYDDIGQMTLLRRAFTAILSLDSKDSTGKMVERFVSLRHVNKEKQTRPNQGKGGGNGSSGGGGAGPGLRAAAPAQSPDQSKHKHEGESVNTEIRCTKDRIEFRSGDSVVGYYEASSQTWYFKGKIASMEFDTESHKVGQRFETIGKTYLGLDNKGEGAPLGETGDIPYKQTFVKLGG
jgi:phage gp45-like